MGRPTPSRLLSWAAVMDSPCSAWWDAAMARASVSSGSGTFTAGTMAGAGVAGAA